MTLVLAQATEAAAAGPSTLELVVFLIIGAVALGSALSVVLLRNAVHAALMLVVNFFTIAMLYAVLEAQFLGVVQIIVYAGAIMVLFLFVIMLLGVDREEPRTGDRLPVQKPLAAVFGVVLFIALAVGVAGPYLASESACPAPPEPLPESAEGLPCEGLAGANRDGNTEGVGALLYSHYVWPFEVTSALLVIAALGAIVLGRKREDPRDLVDQPVDEADEPAPEPEAEPVAVAAVTSPETAADAEDDLSDAAPQPEPLQVEPPAQVEPPPPPPAPDDEPDETGAV